MSTLAIVHPIRLAALGLTLVACGGGGTPRPEGAVAPATSAATTPGSGSVATPAAAAFKVGLLSPGPISDHGWNAAAYEGLLAIQKQLGAEIGQVETRTPPQFEDGFRGFAGQGFRLVFGHGFEFQDAAAKVGAEFPGTVFVTTSGTTVRPNVAPMVFRLEEATYLLGQLAARISKSGKAGVIGGVEIPSVASTFLAFEAGVRSVKPDMPVLKAWVGSWEDVSAAKEAALAQIRQGADIVLHNADAAGIGVFRAVEEASRPDAPVWAFGSNKDQAAVAPRVVLASAVLDIPRAFLRVAERVRDGQFEPKVMELGMKDGIVSLVWNPELESRVPAEVRSGLEQTRAGILAGTVEVPRGF